MAFDVSAENFFSELLAAEKFADDHTKVSLSLWERFATPWFKSQGGRYDPENSSFEYVSLMLPKLIYHMPKSRVKSRNAVQRKQIAPAMQHGLNRWGIDADAFTPLERAIFDSLFGFGILLTTEEPVPGYIPGEVDADGSHNEAVWPRWYRITSTRYGMDCLASSQREARFQYHKWVFDKADLESRAEANPDEGWNVEAIRALAEDTGLDKLKRQKPHEVSRKEIVGYDIWVPEHEVEGADGHEEGFHGSIFTVAVGMSQRGRDPAVQFIRDPRPYYGPRWGPYTMFGSGYFVRDDPYPLASLVAVEGQTKELNDHVKAESKRAARHKKIAVVDALDKAIQDMVAKAPDGSVIPIAGFDTTKVQELTLGAPSELMQGYIAILRDRRDRALSMSDTLRGQANAGATATADQLAALATDTRLAFQLMHVHKSSEQALKTVAWYLYHNPDVQFGLGEDAAREFGGPVSFKGGETHKEPGFRKLLKQLGLKPEQVDAAFGSFDDLELELDLVSIPYQDKAAEEAKAVSKIQLVTGMLPVAAQFSEWPGWEPLMRSAEDALGIEGLALMFGPAAMESLGKAQQALSTPPGSSGKPAASGGGGGGTPSPPRVSMPQGPMRAISGGGRVGNAPTNKMAGAKPQKKMAGAAK